MRYIYTPTSTPEDLGDEIRRILMDSIRCRAGRRRSPVYM